MFEKKKNFSQEVLSDCVFLSAPTELIVAILARTAQVDILAIGRLQLTCKFLNTLICNNYSPILKRQIDYLMHEKIGKQAFEYYLLTAFVYYKLHWSYINRIVINLDKSTEVTYRESLLLLLQKIGEDVYTYEPPSSPINKVNHYSLQWTIGDSFLLEPEVQVTLDNIKNKTIILAGNRKLLEPFIRIVQLFHVLISNQTKIDELSPDVLYNRKLEAIKLALSKEVRNLSQTFPAYLSISNLILSKFSKI